MWYRSAVNGAAVGRVADVALALYRKYRPATFGDVVGQEHVTDPLRAALAAGRINHAYLFSGPRGCGKTSCARILARSLNCEQGPTDEPCGSCGSCVALAPEGPGSIDVVELDAASHGGVDDARDLRDRAFYTPAESRYRVFIIDEAHMVTAQGFNALLKIVEEPPEHLVFVFATTEPEKVLATIRSRTHHYPFRLLPPSVMRGLAEQLCTAEGVSVDPAVYPLVLRAGGGSARDTLSVLDQLLAGADEQGVTYERAAALLGVTDAALLDDMVSALAAGDGATVFATVDQMVEAGHDPRRFAADLLQRFRDLLLLRVAPDAAGQGLLDVPEPERRSMSDQAERLGAASLTRFAEIVHTGLTEMRGATSPRLLLELLCSRMLLPAAQDGDAAILHRLERLERRLTIASDAPPAAVSGAGASDSARDAPARDRAAAPQPTASAPEAATPEAAGAAPAPEPETPEPATAAEPPPAEPPGEQPGDAEQSAGGLDAAAVRRAWSSLLEAVQRHSRTTQVLMSNATARAVERDVLVLTLPTAPLARRLAEDRNVELIRTALREVLGVEWRVRCEHEGDASSSGAASGPAAARSDRGRDSSAGQSAVRQDPPASVTASVADTSAAEAPEAAPAEPAPAEAPTDTPADPYEMADMSDTAGADPVQVNPAQVNPAQANPAQANPPQANPEQAAVELLTQQLGARRLGE